MILPGCFVGSWAIIPCPLSPVEAYKKSSLITNLDPKCLPDAIGGFEELFNLLMESNKQNKEYENIKYMKDEEKIVSFMNNYFVFIKTTEVDVNSIFNMYVKKTAVNKEIEE